MVSMNVELVTAKDCDAEILYDFLRRMYSETKAEFILEHGAWLHRGNRHRFVLLHNGIVAGYCAVIPARIRLNGAARDAIWWVDLVIDPAYRGKGLQTRFDDTIRAMTDLKLGFPNALAAKIHRKHQWGVHENGLTLLAPLHPIKLKSIVQTRGAKRFILRMSAIAMTPYVSFMRSRLCREMTSSVSIWDNPDSDEAARVFYTSHKSPSVTTMRDQEFFNWRYIEAPYARELTWYRYESKENGSVVFITRLFDIGKITVTRVLDVFGDIYNEAAIYYGLIRIYQDSVKRGSSQITIMATLPHLQKAAKRCGFSLSSLSRFCWHSESSETMEAFRSQPLHWVLGDSDNDEPA